MQCRGCRMRGRSRDLVEHPRDCSVRARHGLRDTGPRRDAGARQARRQDGQRVGYLPGQRHPRRARRGRPLVPAGRLGAHLHLRQEDGELHHLPGLQRLRRQPWALQEVLHAERLRERPERLQPGSRLRAQRQVLHDAHGRSRRRSAVRTAERTVPRARRGGIHADGPDPDARTGDAPGRPDRMDRHQSIEQHLRRHGAGAVPHLVQHAQPPARGDDLQSGSRPRRRRLARDVRRCGRRRLRRIAQSGDSHEPAASRHDGRQDRAHHSRPEGAHGHQHRQRERPLPHSERQSIHGDGRRQEGDLGLRPAQPAPPHVRHRSVERREQPARRKRLRPEHLGDGLHHPQGRELRVSAARGGRGAPAGQQDHGAAGRRQDSRDDRRHGDGRHRGADVCGDHLGPRRTGRRLLGERLSLQRQGHPVASGQVRLQRPDDRPHLVRRLQRDARRRRWKAADDGDQARGEAAVERSARHAGQGTAALRHHVPDRPRDVSRARGQE